MKKKNLIGFLTIALFLGILISGCGKSDKETSSKEKETVDFSSSEGNLVEVKVPTVQCNLCKETIEDALDKVDGVNYVDVDVSNKIAKVKFDETKMNIENIEDAITAAGYQANDKPENKDAYNNLPRCCKKSEDR
ncbi:MAG: cation transporter [Bacteroidetes bacterium]|nr:cation transporter [Bacteroidota bacterium]